MADKLRHRLLIDSFLAGEIGLDDLTQRLPAALAASGGTAADNRVYLDQLRASGRLPPQLHALLSTIQPAATAAPAGETPILLDRPVSPDGRKDTQRRQEKDSPRRQEKVDTESPLYLLVRDAMPARTILPPSGERPEGRDDDGDRRRSAAPLPPSRPADEGWQQAPAAASSGRSLGFAPRPTRQAGEDASARGQEYRERSTPEWAGFTPLQGDPASLAPLGVEGRDVKSRGTDQMRRGPEHADILAAPEETHSAKLPDDYDPMEGLVVTKPPASVPSGTERGIGREPAPVARDGGAEGRPAYSASARVTSGGAMPLPSHSLRDDDPLPASAHPASGADARNEGPAEGTPDVEARVDEAIFAKYLSTYRSLKDQRDQSHASGDGQKLDALLQPWQTIRFRRDAAKLAEGDSGAVSDFGLDEQEGPTEIGPGDIVNKRFVIERVLGEGGMGTVFKAVDRRQLEAKSPNPFVALKLLSHDFRRHPEAYRALERETRKTQILAHPNIVTVFDFDRDGPVAYMTMELLDGAPLSETLRIYGSTMEWKDVEPVVRGIGAALSYAHEQGIVHADIKPGNIFIMNDGRAKLLDFGIAQAFRESLPSGAGGNGLAGALTPGFASVEMLEGMPAAPKDDIYAFACVIYEMLTGHHPFDGKTASEAEASGDKPSSVSTLTRKQNAALAEGLAFRREDRPATMQSFLEDLIEVKRGWFGR